MCDQVRLLVARLLWHVRRSGAAVFANDRPVLHLLQCCLRHIAAVLESCCSLFAAWYADGVPWARPGCCHSADLPRRRAKFQRVAIFRACEKKRGEKDHTKLYTPTYGRMYACMHAMLCVDAVYVYVMYVCLCVR